MIKINKNTTDIPKSLKSRNTQEKLAQLCKEKKFISENRFEGYPRKVGHRTWLV